jgi:nucleotide-binding universal stress UspA family protein
VPFEVILAPTSGSEEDCFVLDAAYSLSRIFGSHMEVLFLERQEAALAPLRHWASPKKAMQAVRDAGRRLAADRQRAEIHFEAWRRSNHLAICTRPNTNLRPSAAWRDFDSFGIDQISHFGRLADLIVTARPRGAETEEQLKAAHAALLETGRPTLLVPGIVSVQFIGPVLIAWNGSLESDRAVAAALPLLQRSSEVLVYAARDEVRDGASVDDLVHYLAWQGVEASHLPPRKGDDPEIAIFTTARQIQADLIVMGAYTHSRAGERFLGGATRNALLNSETPVFMTH